MVNAWTYSPIMAQGRWNFGGFSSKTIMKPHGETASGFAEILWGQFSHDVLTASSAASANFA
jgi:hypothetical protein